MADFNHDKYLVIIVGNVGSKNILLLFGDGNETFVKSKSYSPAYFSLPYSIAVGDFNRDNWTDIVIANYGTDNVEIYLQICDNTTVEFEMIFPKI